MTGKVNADYINLINVKTLKFNIDATDNFSADSSYEESLGIGYETGVNIAENNIQMTLLIKVDLKEKEGNDFAGGEFKIQFIFNVSNLPELVEQKKDNGFSMAGELAATLMGIAYSTSRGIILSSTEQSVIGGILLPVVNPIKILQSNTQKLS